MMNERQRVKELEQLSAYLDGQLNETDQRQIESRLSSEPELKEIYEGLRKTKLLFSRIPRVRAPRSFALTPEMVKVRKQKQPLFSTLRWATSLAAILLVVTFGAEYILGGAFNARSPMMSEPALESVNSLEEDAMAEEEPATKAAEPQPLIIWGAPGSGGGGDAEAYGMGGGGSADIIDQASPVEPSGDGYPVENAPTTDLRTTSGSSEGETPILGINSDQGGEIISSSEDLAEESDANWLATLSPFQWAEIGLAALTLTGAIMLLIKRKS